MKKDKFILFKMMAMMTPPCRVIDQRLSESFDRKLTLRERMSIRIHNLGCVICDRYTRQMRALHRALRDYAERVHQHEDPTTRLSDDAKMRILESLKKQMP
jgi:hypothetical protein